MKEAISRDIERKLKRTWACFPQTLKIAILRKEIENNLGFFAFTCACLRTSSCSLDALVAVSLLVFYFNRQNSTQKWIEGKWIARWVINQGQGTPSIPCFFLFSRVGFDLLFSIFLFLRAVSKELRLGGGIAENVYANWVMRAVYPGWIAGEKFWT